MIAFKAALKQFRAGDWSPATSPEAFARDVEALGLDEMLKLLAALQDRALLANAQAHSQRRSVFSALVLRQPDPALFDAFVDNVASADIGTRAMLVVLLPRVNNPAGHAKLCGLLGHRDYSIRQAVKGVLAEIAGRTALDTLVRLANDPAFVGRSAALDVLVPKIGHHAAPLVAAVLARGSTEEKLHALGYILPEHMPSAGHLAVKLAQSALEDLDTRVIVAALDALARIAGGGELFQLLQPLLDSPRGEVVVAAVRALSAIDSPRVIPLLKRKLRQGPNPVRLAVVEAAQRIGTEEALAILVSAITLAHIAVRTQAANAIAELSLEGRLDVAQAIVWLLRCHDVNVRRLAVEVVNKSGDPSGNLATRLLEHVTDEDWWVRERVMDSLAKIWPRGLTRHVAKLLDEESAALRRFAVGALARLKDSESLGLLLRTAANDRDWWVREQCIECIGEIGDSRAAPHLLQIAAEIPELCLACVRALGQIKSADSAAEVAQLLDTDDPDVRVAVLECLAALGAKEQALWVASCENDPDHRVRNAANDLLQSWHCATDAVAQVNARQGLDAWLLAAVDDEADDLILAADRVPHIKRLGKMQPLGVEPLPGDALEALLLPILSPAQRESLAQRTDVDFSYEVKGTRLRFRANVFHQLPGLSAVFRAVKGTIPEMASLDLPAVVKTLPELRNGLVLIGGPTGSGKSTTLAAIIDHINKSSQRHIITIEDPVEVVHESKASLINQREVGTHTRSFDKALRAALRQDPDVILVGEMRDLDTIAFAVTAAETGHLVFGTVHTVSADTSIDRIVNVFPPKQQDQVRTMMADALRAVVCQHLLRKKGANGRVLAAEVLMVNDAVASMIRNGKTFQIPQVVATSRDAGMQSMDWDLARLVRTGAVEYDEAFMKAIDKRAFEAMALEATPAPPSSSRGVPAAPPSTPGRVPPAPASSPGRVPPAPPTSPGFAPPARSSSSGQMGPSSVRQPRTGHGSD